MSLLAMFLLTLYIIPAIVAYARDHNNKGAILALNILAGWTIAGWIIACVWAFTSNVQHTKIDTLKQ